MTVVVVTGATGLLGANVAMALLQHGYRVRGICRNPARTQHLKGQPIEWTVADLTDKFSLMTAFRGASAVIHCAGDTTQSCWLTPSHLSVNVLGTRNVIRASTSAGIGRLVHCSSSTTCGVSLSERPATEQSLELGESELFSDGYTRSKSAAERVALDAASQMDIVIVNPGYLLGPYDAKPTSGRLILRVAERKAPGWPTGWNSFVDVRDVAEGVVRALKNGRRGERYIMSGENLPYRTVMHLAAKTLGVPPPRIPIPPVVARMAGLAGDTKEWLTRSSGDINSATVRYGTSQTFRFSSAKAERELGYTSRPVQQAIDDAVEWFSCNGMLPPS